LDSRDSAYRDCYPKTSIFEPGLEITYCSADSYVALDTQLTAAKTVQILLMLNPEFLEGFSTQRGLSYKLIYEKELMLIKWSIAQKIS
jgi:hypothetical protein